MCTVLLSQSSENVPCTAVEPLENLWDRLKVRLFKISVLGLQLFSHNIIFYCCILEEFSKADPEYFL